MHLNRLKCSALLIKNSRTQLFYGHDQVGSVQLRFGSVVGSCSLPKLSFLCGSKSCNRRIEHQSHYPLEIKKSHLFSQQMYV